MPIFSMQSSPGMGPQGGLMARQTMADLPDAYQPMPTKRGLGGPPLDRPTLDDPAAMQAVMSQQPGGLAMPGRDLFPGTRSINVTSPQEIVARQQFMDTGRAGLQQQTMGIGAMSLAREIAPAQQAQQTADMVRSASYGQRALDTTGALADRQAAMATEFSQAYRAGLMGQEGDRALNRMVTVLSQVPPHMRRAG